MKTDYLKNLGITEQSTIDAIMAENGRDINAAKGELENYKNQVSDLRGQLTAKDNEIATLQTKVANVDNLTAEVAQLKTDNTNLTNELNTKVTQMQKAHAIENGVRDAKAKNVKAVMALLDMEKITYNEDKLEGLSEQLTALQGGETTSFLFGEANPAPAGSSPSTPPTGGNPPTAKSLAEAVANALGANK